MARIEINHEHQLDHEQARATVARIAEDLARKIHTQSSWQGDTLQFSRPGVTGRIEVHPDHVRVVADLGLALTPLKPMIQREVTRLLQENLGSP